MLAFFPRISVSDAHAQQQRVLEQSAAEAAIVAEERRRAALIRPGPGRPRKALDANEVLKAAAAAAAAAPLDAAEQEDDEPASKRGKYANWFAGPHIHDILAAYQLNLHNAKQTVRYLQRSYPRLPTETAGRFDSLAESTIRSTKTTAASRRSSSRSWPSSEMRPSEDQVGSEC